MCRLLLLQVFWVYMINIAFSALAVVHLTYLGSVFTSSVDYMEEDEVSDGETCTTIQTGADGSSSLLCRMI